MTARGRNLGLRYLGIILPIGVACLYSFAPIPHVAPAGYVAVSVLLWFVFTVALVLRRDWSGALAIGIIYVIINVPVNLLLLGHPMAGMR